MSESIKATCPGCRKLIRIPLDWSDRAMKCKKCGTLVQMKKKDTSPSAVETAIAPPATTATVPAYEPSCDPPAPAPQPAFSYPVPPPAPVYAPPQYPDPHAHPYGHPSPYPMPPQYAAPQPPGYGYPYPPQPPAYGYPPPQHYPPPQYPPQPAYNFGAPPPQAPAAEAFPTNEDAGPSRRQYQRNSGNGAQKMVVLAIAAVFVVGLAIVAMKMTGGANEGTSQAKGSEGKATAKETAPGSSTPAPTPPAPSIISDPFPRRMLFVHLSKYVYFNNLAPGVFGRGEDMPTRTANQMAYEFRVRTDGANNQLYVYCDTGGKPVPPPLKSVLMQTFEQFFATSREQDRIVIYFGGHAREIDSKAYLVPVDGEPDDASTLLPVEELYAKLASCKAQQKVLLFDVCRFNPGYGAARAGSEPMSEKLAEALHKAPPGVQVLTSCSAGQNAQETSETGSEFLTAFRAKAKELKSSGALAAAQPGQAIPMEKWADSLREYLAAKRDYAPPQTVKATVPPQDAATAIAYKKEEPGAPRFPWPNAPTGANPGEVNAMLALIDLPGIRKEIELPPGLASVYPFSAEVMKDYMPDIPDEESVKGDKYPLRKATFDALSYIRDHWKFGTGEGLRESLNGSVDDNLKKEIAKDQMPIAKLILELEEHMGALELAGKKIGEEKSKRWQALHAYALAQIQMRWAFINEYNFALGNIKTDSLEKPMGGGTPVYRLVSIEKMKSKKDITDKVETARESFEKMAKDHKGTPLEIVAKMNKSVSLGLTWKLENQQNAMGDDKMEKK